MRVRWEPGGRTRRVQHQGQRVRSNRREDREAMTGRPTPPMIRPIVYEREHHPIDPPDPIVDE